MGIETFLIASVASGFLGSMQEQAGIKEQAEAQQEELRRQQEEANRQAAEEKSDLALEMDKRLASARAAMEAIGGFGSVNDERAQAEIAGLKGLDLARIEGNRSRQVDALKAAQRSVRKKAKASIIQSQSAFLSSALSAGADMSMFNAQREREADAAEAANGAISYPFTP